jgi:hypothetical protein
MPAGAPAGGPGVPSGSFSTLSYLKSKGYNPSWKDDEEATGGLLQAAVAYHQSEPLIRAGQIYQQHAAEFNEFLTKRNQAMQNAGAQTPAPAAPQQQLPQAGLAPAAGGPAPQLPKWERPEFSPDWLQYVRQDQQTGLYEPIHPALAPYAAKLNAYRQWESEAARRLVNEWPDLVQQQVSVRLQELEKRMSQQFDERLRQGISNYEALNQSRQFVHANLQHFYMMNGDGSVAVDPRTGQQLLTPMGSAFVSYAQEAQRMGHRDPAMIQQYALRLLEADMARGRFGQQPAAQQPNGQQPAGGNGQQPNGQQPASQREAFINRIRQTPNRGAPPPQNPVEVIPPRNLDAFAREVIDSAAREAGLLPPP